MNQRISAKFEVILCSFVLWVMLCLLSALVVAVDFGLNNSSASRHRHSSLCWVVWDDKDSMSVVPVTCDVLSWKSKVLLYFSSKWTYLSLNALATERLVWEMDQSVSDMTMTLNSSFKTSYHLILPLFTKTASDVPSYCTLFFTPVLEKPQKSNPW